MPMRGRGVYDNLQRAGWIEGIGDSPCLDHSGVFLL
jgi:hypothetical protein